MIGKAWFGAAVFANGCVEFFFFGYTLCEIASGVLSRGFTVAVLEPGHAVSLVY